jgi:Type I restriction-modification system methyltransferase subunit
MLDKELSAKVHYLWNLFRSAGSSNALSSLEQITYLIALKRLEALDQPSARKRTAKNIPLPKAYPRWSEFIKLKSQQDKFEWFKNTAFPYLKNLTFFGDAFHFSMLDAVFGISKPKLLVDAVNIIDELPFGDERVDVQGEIYESLLSQLSFAGKHGQFLTPRHIIQTIVELCDPQPGERICDPSAGTAGFLVSAYERLRKAQADKGDLNQEDFVGYDFDTTIVRLGLMNMMLHGIKQPEYYRQDSLSEGLKPRQFDLVMSSPPFGGAVDRKTINKKLLTLKTQKIELLFVELSLALLKVQGRCAVIVPEGVTFGTDSPTRALREQIINDYKLEAVISLPRGCFLPYTGSKTSILLVQKGGVTDQVLLYEVTGDGFTLNEKRSPDPENNDLALVPQTFRALVRGDDTAWASTATKELALKRSLLVSKNEIKANGLSFSIGLYRKLGSATKVQETPRQIIENIHSLQEQIRLKLTDIETMIQEVTDA